MIRTRDFFLYVLVLLFLLLGIGFTVSLENKDAEPTISSKVRLITAEQETPSATVEMSDLDRDVRIAELKKKLAAGQGVISEGPPVLTSVDTIVAVDSLDENLDAGVLPTERSPRYCATLNEYEGVVSEWPKEGAIIELREGARMVTIQKSDTVASGSTTETATVEALVMQLPVSPSRGWSNCLDSDIVGIALDGSLIHNNETWRFRGISSESVVGYARDGIPIFGQGTDESLLDSCGGYDTGAGYQYHLRESELFVLGCFAAVPQPFLE